MSERLKPVGIQRRPKCMQTSTRDNPNRSYRDFRLTEEGKPVNSAHVDPIFMDLSNQVTELERLRFS